MSPSGVSGLKKPCLTQACATVSPCWISRVTSSTLSRMSHHFHRFSRLHPEPRPQFPSSSLYASLLCLCLPSCSEILLRGNDRLLPAIWHIRLFVLSFFHPSGQTPPSLPRLPRTHSGLPAERHSPSNTFVQFLPESPHWGIFWVSSGISDGPRHINSGEPALLSHMVQHPLINATLCCVTKSQLHHAFYDWSALTVVDGI